MLKKILIVIAVLIVGVLAYAATRPDSFHFERSTEIKAPPEKIFAVLNDFRQGQSWSPYEKKDPAMKRTFSGPATGKGSVYAFEGNNEIGTGSLEIVESIPAQKIALRLDMIKPFEGSNNIEFRLEPKGDTTKVTWAMNGPSPYVAKLISVFIDCEAMMAKDFDAGLADLKSLLEKS